MKPFSFGANGEGLKSESLREIAKGLREDVKDKPPQTRKAFESLAALVDASAGRMEALEAERDEARKAFQLRDRQYRELAEAGKALVEAKKERKACRKCAKVDPRGLTPCLACPECCELEHGIGAPHR